MATAAVRAAPKKGIRLSWSDPRLRNIVWQILVVGAVAYVVWYLASNTARNLALRNIATGFGFLGREAGLPIGESLLPYEPTDTYARALLIGVLNTLKVAFAGCILATIFGTLLGIARLSRNWLMARLASAYVEVARVEVARDLPLVLIIGIFDLLTAGKTAIVEPAWQGFGVEVYVAVGVIYFVFCFAMSKYSQGLEAEFNKHVRR